MPPVDNTNAPTPEPRQPLTPEQSAGPEKKGFWDKLKHLFEKKVAPQEPHYSTENDKPIPVDQIGTDTPTQETAPADNAPSDQPTDPQTGAPQASESSAPDADGSTTAPEVAVPEDVQANPGEETPTVPGAPSSGDQFTQPSTPEEPQQANQQQAPQHQQYPQPPTQQQPPFPPQQPPQNQ